MGALSVTTSSIVDTDVETVPGSTSAAVAFPLLHAAVVPIANLPELGNAHVHTYQDSFSHLVVARFTITEVTCEFLCRSHSTDLEPGYTGQDLQRSDYHVERPGHSSKSLWS